MHPHRSVRLALLLASLVLPACGGGATDDAAAAPSAVVGGTPAIDERPEVGRVGSCTGTLVASNVVLSAAHCFDRESGARSVGDFVIDRTSGSRAFATTEVKVFGDGSGEDDVALVRLASPVPGDVARPLAIATSPAQGEVTMWGYGCTARPARIPSGEGNVITSGEPEDKRKVIFVWGSTTSHSCPGDSGGPVVDARGRIVAVVSGYVALPYEEARGFDVFGDPVRHAAAIGAQIASWR